MFERYTEAARRTIFFARYEASQFGSMTIETEHLLLGLIRENRTNHLLRDRSAIQTIRKDVEARITIREKVPTSIDLPISNECERILSYAGDEAARLNHLHIWYGAFVARHSPGGEVCCGRDPAWSRSPARHNARTIGTRVEAAR